MLVRGLRGFQQHPRSRRRRPHHGSGSRHRRRRWHRPHRPMAPMRNSPPGRCEYRAARSWRQSTPRVGVPPHAARAGATASTGVRTNCWRRAARRCMESTGVRTRPSWWTPRTFGCVKGSRWTHGVDPDGTDARSSPTSLLESHVSTTTRPKPKAACFPTWMCSAVRHKASRSGCTSSHSITPTNPFMGTRPLRRETR